MTLETHGRKVCDTCPSCGATEHVATLQPGGALADVGEGDNVVATDGGAFGLPTFVCALCNDTVCILCYQGHWLDLHGK